MGRPRKNPLGTQKELRANGLLPYQQRSQIDLVHEARDRKYEELDRIEVELQVGDGDHYRSEEVLTFSVNHLRQGGTWAALRRKLGLGPASVDYRWRKIRNLVVNHLIPKSEMEALENEVTNRAILEQKLDEIIENIDSHMSVLGMDKVDKMVMPTYIRMKIDALKMRLDSNNRSLDAYLAIKKLQEGEKKNQGPSLVIQNLYMTPRPGDDLKMRQVVEISKELDGTRNLERLPSDEEG